MSKEKERRMSIFGKCTEDFKLRLAFSTTQILQMRAMENGMSFAEYCRTVLESHAHGRAEVIRLQQERLIRVIGEGE